MKTSKYIFGLIFLIMGIFGCSDDKSENIENVRETLIGSTWLQYSRLYTNSTEFKKYSEMDKFNFYDNGEYRVYGLLGIPGLFKDTLKFMGKWEYDTENRVISFTNTTLLVDQVGFSVREKLKILEINKDRFIAQPIYDQWEGNISKEIYVREVK